MPASKNTLITKGDILYVCGYNGTSAALWMTSARDAGDMIHELDNDEPLIFIESTDVFYKVVSSFGVGWVHFKDTARQKGVSLREEMSGR